MSFVMHKSQVGTEYRRAFTLDRSEDLWYMWDLCPAYERSKDRKPKYLALRYLETCRLGRFFCRVIEVFASVFPEWRAVHARWSTAPGVGLLLCTLSYLPSIGHSQGLQGSMAFSLCTDPTHWWVVHEDLALPSWPTGCSALKQPLYSFHHHNHRDWH